MDPAASGAANAGAIDGVKIVICKISAHVNMNET